MYFNLKRLKSGEKKIPEMTEQNRHNTDHAYRHPFRKKNKISHFTQHRTQRSHKCHGNTKEAVPRQSTRAQLPVSEFAFSAMHPADKRQNQPLAWQN